MNNLVVYPIDSVLFLLSSLRESATKLKFQGILPTISKGTAMHW